MLPSSRKSPLDNLSTLYSTRSMTQNTNSVSPERSARPKSPTILFRPSKRSSSHPAASGDTLLGSTPELRTPTVPARRICTISPYPPAKSEPTQHLSPSSVLSQTDHSLKEYVAAGTHSSWWINRTLADSSTLTNLQPCVSLCGVLTRYCVCSPGGSPRRAPLFCRCEGH